MKLSMGDLNSCFTVKNTVFLLLINRVNDYRAGGGDFDTYLLTNLLLFIDMQWTRFEFGFTNNYSCFQT